MYHTFTIQRRKTEINKKKKNCQRDEHFNDLSFFR